MGRENQGSVLKTVIKFTEPIKIDGNTVNMPVTLTFNEEKGTGVINLQLSTKMLSADKSQRDLVFCWPNDCFAMLTLSSGKSMSNMKPGTDLATQTS